MSPSTMPIFESILDARSMRFAIVASRFNQMIVNQLIDGAKQCIRTHGGNEAEQSLFWVPGAWEIPVVASKLANSKRFNGIICLGAVIRGATGHYDIVANGSANGIQQVAVSSQIPITNGILTCETLEQAFERAGTKVGNQGYNAALAAIDVACLMKQIS